ncbi:alpha-2,8-sialyltransferase 8E-like [Chanos chanos]|uniref:Alpha-2,8-sialyltransferase 8E-like n=1 Tax=Chanos chanos TaxID=29144 RepID=A0A6J2VHR5_CHACN|nr:alpha-2,8-sialyltransferase 8E-like [Chanos chanos]
MKWFTEALTQLLHCPPKYNITHQELLRGSGLHTRKKPYKSFVMPAKKFNGQELDSSWSVCLLYTVSHSHNCRVRLRSCCNATGILYLTKRNTYMNQTILYETSAKLSHKVDSTLYSMLPETLPWYASNLGRCAVVGSGGILKNSKCGAEIDSTDFVIRFNLAPLKESDVGMKSDLMTVNPSQIRKDYKNFKEDPRPLVQRLSVYRNTSLLTAAFSYTINTALSIDLHKALRPQHKVVFFSPSYLKELDQFWKRHGLKAVRLSSGFILISVALELCDHVHIYGFWPFSTNLNQKRISHHYYDNIGPKKGVHAMPEEYLHLLQLHSQGVLTMHLENCV